MKTNRIKQLITNLFIGAASVTERTEVAKWMNSEEAESDSKAAWECASTEIDSSLKNEIWKEIRMKIEDPVLQTNTTKKVFIRRWQSIPRVAASIAVILCTAFAIYVLYDSFISHKENPASNIYTFEVKPGQKGSMHLADGTVVYLNSSSKISFAGDYNSENRIVTLSGEAYFEVAKNPDKRFIVTCNGVDIEALGTEFNVKAYPADSIITTTLAQGKVKVYSNEQSITLLPNGVATYDLKRQTIESSTVEDVSIANYWRTGQLVFDAEPLSSIARTIERMYNVKINIDDPKLKDIKFTGTIQNNSLNNVFYTMSLSYPLTYTMTDSIITVSAHSNPINVINQKSNRK